MLGGVRLVSRHHSLLDRFCCTKVCGAQWGLRQAPDRRRMPCDDYAGQRKHRAEGAGHKIRSNGIENTTVMIETFLAVAFR